VAGHELITAHLDTLAARLPAQAVEELADGLEVTFEQHLAKHGDPTIAARAALDEFGDADLITAAFLRESQGRRTARALLATGPVMGVVWGATLITSHAWTWPVPPPIRLLYAAALVMAVLALVVAARETFSYRRSRRAALVGMVGLVLLDGLMLTAVAVLTPTATWPVTVAVTASSIRILGTSRALPAILIP
jgi:hypothetical protein